MTKEQNDIISFKKILLLKNNSNSINDINNNNESKEEYIYNKYYEGHSKGYLFWIFGKTVFISVFGDAYMLAIITNSAISNFKGTLFGSSLAILIHVKEFYETWNLSFNATYNHCNGNSCVPLFFTGAI